MNNYVSIFEIPATDLERAVRFYHGILEIPIERIDIPEMHMALFPYEDQQTVGVIIQGEGYTPSTEGVTLYLNAGEDLQVVLAKVEEHGGKILVPKTAHADESGFFAQFIDSEGNRLGLHSPR